MLVLEDGDTFYRGGGVTRRWLAPREGVHAGRLATYFGEVSLHIRASAEAGVVEATAQLHALRPAQTAWLVVRTRACRPGVLLSTVGTGAGATSREKRLSCRARIRG